MVVFSPWAFGTTQPWSILTMNVAGGLLGALLPLLVVGRCFGALGGIPVPSVLLLLLWLALGGCLVHATVDFPMQV